MAGSMREADEARVATWSARWHVALAGVILAATVLMLGVQNRRLRQTQRDLMRRFTQPHRGDAGPGLSRDHAGRGHRDDRCQRRGRATSAVLLHDDLPAMPELVAGHGTARAALARTPGRVRASSRSVLTRWQRSAASLTARGSPCQWC